MWLEDTLKNWKRILLLVSHSQVRMLCQAGMWWAFVLQRTMAGCFMLGGWERGCGACLALCSFLRVNSTLWLYPMLHRISSTACAPTSSTCTRSSSSITQVGWLFHHGTVAGRVEGLGWLPRRLAVLLDLSVCTIFCCTPPASRPMRSDELHTVEQTGRWIKRPAARN